MLLFKALLAGLVSFAAAWPSSTSTACNANNCARAVTGTRLGPSHSSVARADCSTLLAAPPASQTVPSSVADHCTNFAQYSSACSCWGVSPIPTCAGNACGSINPCSVAGCFCFEGAGSSGFCGENTPCSEDPVCNTDADCPPGLLCAVNTCCFGNPNVCLAPCIGASKKRSAEKRQGVNYPAGPP